MHVHINRYAYIMKAIQTFISALLKPTRAPIRSVCPTSSPLTALDISIMEVIFSALYVLWVDWNVCWQLLRYEFWSSILCLSFRSFLCRRFIATFDAFHLIFLLTFAKGVKVFVWEFFENSFKIFVQATPSAALYANINLFGEGHKASPPE